MKIFSGVFLLLFTAGQLFGQYQSDDIKSTYRLFYDVTLVNDVMKKTYIDGTPYSTQEKSNGVFYMKNKGVIETPTRINYYYSSFEFENNNETHIASQSTLDSVLYAGSIYYFRTFPINGISHIHLVKVLDRKGKTALYEFTGVDLLPEVKASGYVDPKPPRYQWNNPVYLFELGDKLVVLNTFKSLTAEFPAKELEIKKFIKDNKISKNNADELILLCDYISHL